jgi:hypothetical protein
VINYQDAEGSAEMKQHEGVKKSNIRPNKKISLRDMRAHLEKQGVDFSDPEYSAIMQGDGSEFDNLIKIFYLHKSKIPVQPQNNVTRLYELYNWFRMASGLLWDFTPVEGLALWGDPATLNKAKPIYLPDIPPGSSLEEIEKTLSPKLTLSLSPCATDKEIDQEVTRIREQAKTLPRHWSSFAWLKDTAGKNLPDINRKIDEIQRCLVTWYEYKSTGNKAEVSRRRGRFKSEYGTAQRINSTARVTPYLKRAEKLIAAAETDFDSFLKVAAQAAKKYRK